MIANLKEFIEQLIISDSLRNVALILAVTLLFDINSALKNILEEMRK